MVKHEASSKEKLKASQFQQQIRRMAKRRQEEASASDEANANSLGFLGDLPSPSVITEELHTEMQMDEENLSEDEEELPVFGAPFDTVRNFHRQLCVFHLGLSPNLISYYAIVLRKKRKKGKTKKVAG